MLYCIVLDLYLGIDGAGGRVVDPCLRDGIGGGGGGRSRLCVCSYSHDENGWVNDSMMDRCTCVRKGVKGQGSRVSLHVPMHACM